MEVDYYNYFFIVNFIKISSLVSVVYIIKKFNTSNRHMSNMKYYQGYFSLAFILTLMQDIGIILKLPVEFLYLVGFYILTTIVLMYVLNEKMRQRRVTSVVAFFFTLFIVSALYMGYSNSEYLFIHAVFSLAVYSYLAYLVLKKAHQLDNIGYKIMFSSFMLIVIVAFLELYELFRSNVPAAFAYAEFSANSGFILFIIGFLTVNIVYEKQYLNTLALKDTLTGMNNRRGLDYMLDSIIPSLNRENRCFSVITIDIDFFKKINDTYGHDGGDIVLSEFAKLIKSTHRNNDISCRFGGEEFVIVLPDTNKENSMVMAEKLRKNIEENSIFLNNIAVNITASFGVATSCDKIEIDALIKDSDKALYIAKYAGRNMVIHIEDNCIL